MAFSQDSLFKEMQHLVLENDSLQKQVIAPLRDSLSIKNVEISKLQDQIKAFGKIKSDYDNQIISLDAKIAGLDKNKLKIERDTLQKRIDELIGNSVTLQKEINSKSLEISRLEQLMLQKEKEAKEIGKSEALALIISNYIENDFDFLVSNSTKNSIERDKNLIGDNEATNKIILDLEKYFAVLDLLNHKYESASINKASTTLKLIERESSSLNHLKDMVEYYKNYSDALVETIVKLTNFDTQKSADGKAEIQELKFKDIMSILSDYMYNYYDYEKYPYLSNIFSEILNRKRENADANLNDIIIKMR